MNTRLFLAVSFAGLAGCLTGCPTAQPPEAPVEGARDPQWWRGVWVIDVDRLLQQTQGLSPPARTLSEALVRALNPHYRYELAPDAFSRQPPKGETLVPTRLRRLGADEVELDGGDRGRLRLRRGKGGVILTDGGRPIPVRQVKE